MPTININGTDFTIHGTVDGAIAYAQGTPGTAGAAFRALEGNDDAIGRLLVQATRTLFSLGWQGTPTVAAQRTAFPRDGVLDRYGQAVVDGTTPQDIIDAEYELAIIYAANAAAKDAINTGSNIKRMEAGPVNIEYHRPTDALDTALPLPKVVWDLVAPYLGSAVDGFTATAYGVDPCDEPAAASDFEDCDAYTRVVR